MLLEKMEIYSSPSAKEPQCNAQTEQDKMLQPLSQADKHLKSSKILSKLGNQGTLT